ncbi:MAG TPA: M1 family aminopeptidase [Candidatus Polarisedimenticolia bacterium]|jgi:hypothetical protein
MRTRGAAGGLILLVAFPCAATGPAQAGEEKGRLPPPTRLERLQVRGGEDASRRGRVARAVQSALAALTAPVDVQRYTIDLKVIPSTQRVEGTVRIQARARSGGASSLDVGLYDVLAVGSIVRTGTGTTLAFTRATNLLHITLDRAYAAGELIDLTIAYSGTPANAGYGSFSFKTHGSPAEPIVASLSEPYYAPSWWSCIDDPSDKAIVDMNLNVPGGLVGVSNGLLVATILNADGTLTYQWRSGYPISTYLVSVAISNYATWTDTYDPVTGGPPMPVQHWVYPEHLTEAQTDFSVTVPMLTFFSGLFGEYPFVAEKYGHAIFPFGGGMEHQTVTSYGAGLIHGDGSRYWVIAHEMAHQWWGDSVTLADWSETWLNEGFASYSEALWYEHLYGAPGLRTYMAGFDSRPFCGTLHGTVCDLFGSTIYDKGAWVLHMLRHVVGDPLFFQGMRDWAADHQYGNGTTPDFRATMEAASGLFLGDFFDRWVYQIGEPSYRWGWTAAPTSAGWVTHVRIEQIQSEAPFMMPIDLRVDTAAGASTFVVENGATAQDVALPPVPSAPTGVALDPDYWILKSVTVMTLPDADGDGVPDTADNCGQTYNPAQEDLDTDGLGDPCDGDMDGDGRSNAADCAPADPLVQDPPNEATDLDVAGGTVASLSWSPDPAQGNGLTFELLRGDVALLMEDGGVASAECLALGLASPNGIDGDPPPAGGSFYYLVRKRNVCGGGTLGTGSDGQTRVSLSCP